MLSVSDETDYTRKRISMVQTKNFDNGTIVFVRVCNQLFGLLNRAARRRRYVGKGTRAYMIMAAATRFDAHCSMTQIASLSSSGSDLINPWAAYARGDGNLARACTTPDKVLRQLPTTAATSVQ